MRARFTTLVGMNHIAGQHGPLPRTVLAKLDTEQTHIDRLFANGFQTVVVITPNAKNPTLVQKP
jgi:hypothetical protein